MLADTYWTNEAFKSLSFRGRQGYPTHFMTTRPQPPQNGGLTPHNTYGAILVLRSPNQATKYALVQGRYTGKWSFPKGHADGDETGLECALREVAEETGLDPTTLLPHAATLAPHKIGYGNYFVFTPPTEIPLVPRDIYEIMDARWCSLEEMSRLELNADASQFYRAQTGDLKRGKA